MRKITSKELSSRFDGPEAKYHERNDARRYPFETPFSTTSSGSTRMRVLFGRFKVREGELKSVNVQEEKNVIITPPSNILLTSTAEPIEGKISILADAEAIISAAMEGIEHFRAKLVEMESKPEPTFGMNFNDFLKQQRSGEVADEHDKSALAEKIRRMKNACVGLEGDSVFTPLDLAVVFPSSELPEMIGLARINGTRITFSDFENNASSLINYNRDRHARLLNPVSALLLMKAMVLFE